MTEATITGESERKHKLAKDCKTLAELCAWLGPRWELVEPDTALETLARPSGVVRVRHAS